MENVRESEIALNVGYPINTIYPIYPIWNEWRILKHTDAGGKDSCRVFFKRDRDLTLEMV